MTRRSLLSMLGAAAAGAIADPERLIWTPGKLISIPAVRVLLPGKYHLRPLDACWDSRGLETCPGWIMVNMAGTAYDWGRLRNENPVPMRKALAIVENAAGAEMTTHGVPYNPALHSRVIRPSKRG